MSFARVIIVGGGVTGLSTAYHLARRGVGVVLLEKGPVGDGSSSRAAGIITGLLWSEVGVRARAVSLRLFRELSGELEGYRFQDVGCLNLFDPASWPEREKLLPLYDRLGAPYEILDAAEMRRRWPALQPHDDWIGLHDALGGYSEPDDYLPALANRCRAMGVEIRENAKVLDFLRQGDRVTGVRTADGAVEGDAVVCTVYSWSRHVMAPLGLQLPVKAFVHQRYVTRPLPAPVAIPAVNANPINGYVRPATGNRLLVGIETADREEYRVPSSDFQMATVAAAPELKAEIMATYPPFLPALGETTWEFDRIGLLTFSMDYDPILGPVAALPGFYVGFAFHSGGFAYNPVAGMLLAEYVTEGRTSIDVSGFSPDRFDPAEVEEYFATTIRQRDVGRRRH